MVFFKFHFDNKCFVFNDTIQIDIQSIIQNRILKYKS